MEVVILQPPTHKSGDTEEVTEPQWRSSLREMASNPHSFPLTQYSACGTVTGSTAIQPEHECVKSTMVGFFLSRLMME